MNDATPLIAACAILTGGRACFDYANLLGYDSLASKEVGIGLLVESAARAATDEYCGFLLSGTPFMAIQTGSRKARQLPLRGFTGRPTCLDCRPDWSLSGSLSTTEPLEAAMADLFTSAPAQVTPFTFGTHAVRVIDRDGSPWFICTDVAEALGYRNAPDASRHLDDDEKGTQIVRTLGGAQKLTIINESGLYALVLRSRKPEARKFAKWVTSEVLPAIRKTGQYTAPQAQPVHTGGVRLSELISAGHGIYLDTEELHRIAAACMEKLASRAKFYQARELASRNAGKAVSMSI